MDDRGREALRDDDIIQDALRRGWAVYTVDPRGIGELAIREQGFLFAISLLLGENFVWRQASDITRIIGLVARPTKSERSALYARGINASLIAAYVAAANAGTGSEWIAIRDGIDTFGNGGDLPLQCLPFNVRDMFDVSDLKAAGTARIFDLKAGNELLDAVW